MLNLSFLDVYRCNYVCCSHCHDYFLQPGLQYVAILSLVFIDVYFAVATATTISCSLGLQYRAMLSPSFLDVHRCSAVAFVTTRGTWQSSVYYS